ncbi:MAG TPA: extracellular solute-binding protein [Candidatus Binatia bacterium]
MDRRWIVPAAGAVAVLLVVTPMLLSHFGGDRDEVVFWAMGSEAEVADSLLDGFRAAEPGIAVHVQRIPWSAAHEKLLTAYVAGAMPDVFQIGTTWVPEFAELGALEPMDERIASLPGGGKTFFPGALDTCVIGAKALAVPWYIDTRILFYRQDLLREAGVAEPPHEWQQWRDAMQKFRDAGDPAHPRYGAFLPIDEWQVPVALVLQQGGSLLRDNDCYGNMQSAEARRALGFYVDLFHSGLVPQRSAAQIANLYREFAQGYFAYFVSGPWSLSEVAKVFPVYALHDKWETAPLPAPHAAEGRFGVSIAGGADLAISPASPRKEKAWKLVRYLTAGHGAWDFRKKAEALPARREVYDHDRMSYQDRLQLSFVSQIENLATPPKIPEWERIAAKLTLHLERIVRGDATMDQGLADLDYDIDSILEKRRSLLASRGTPCTTPGPGART